MSAVRQGSGKQPTICAISNPSELTFKLSCRTRARQPVCDTRHGNRVHLSLTRATADILSTRTPQGPHRPRSGATNPAGGSPSTAPWGTLIYSGAPRSAVGEQRKARPACPAHTRSARVPGCPGAPGDAMRAAIFLGGGKPLAVERVTDPAPAPDEVIIEVAHCGICGSDLHMAGVRRGACRDDLRARVRRHGGRGGQRRRWPVEARRPGHRIAAAGVLSLRCLRTRPAGAVPQWCVHRHQSSVPRRLCRVRPRACHHAATPACGSRLRRRRAG